MYQNKSLEKDYEDNEMNFAVIILNLDENEK